MKGSLQQRLNSDDIDQCMDFALRMYECLKTNAFPQVNRYTGPWNINVDDLAQSKAGELMTARYFGFDKDIVLWETKYGPDDGYDLDIDGSLIDVKASDPPFNLIWPLTKNDLLHTKNFHFFVAVSIVKQNLDFGTINGFISKQEFIENKLVADGVTRPRLTKGTWYFPKRLLHKMDRWGDGNSDAGRDVADLYSPQRTQLPIPQVLSSKEGPAPGRQPFLHYCHCGQWGLYGYGVSLRNDREGKWYCAEHRPVKQQSHSPDPPARMEE